MLFHPQTLSYLLSQLFVTHLGVALLFCINVHVFRFRCRLTHHGSSCYLQIKDASTVPCDACKQTPPICCHGSKTREEGDVDTPLMREEEREEEEERDTQDEEEEDDDDGVPYDRGWAWMLVFGNL